MMLRLVTAVLVALLAMPLRADTYKREFHLDVSAAELAALGNLDPKTAVTGAGGCRDLYACICSSTGQYSLDEKTRSWRFLEEQLTESKWDKLPSRITPRQFNEAATSAVQSAEDKVYQFTQVARDELRMALANVKAAVRQRLASSGEAGPEVDPSKVRLVYGREYVDALVQELRKEHPTVGNPALLARAYMLYHQRCGMNGMERNAFLSTPMGPEQLHHLVLCPGLVIYLGDLDSDKATITSAMHFIFGQELGHYIAAARPETGSQIATCIAQETGSAFNTTPRVEAQLAADFWGAYALARRLEKIESSERRMRTAALALQPLCAETGSPEHEKIGRFRISNVIGRHPRLAALLGRAGPSQSARYCSVDARIPVN